MKKIMFNDRYGLTQAVLEGRKTMTRRIVTSDPAILEVEVDEFGLALVLRGTVWNPAGKKMNPRYVAGDVVAVAQKYSELELTTSGIKRVYNQSLDIYEDALSYTPGWSNKMFVKAELMPHKIGIMNVRAERLQRISNEDCKREGIVNVCGLYSCEGLCERGDQLFYASPRGAFAALIDKISGEGTWGSNPWVYVYEFELEK